MRIDRKKSAFTILEVLVASSLTVVLTTFIVIGINAVLDYKKNESAKPQLVLDVYNALNLLEYDIGNKCTAMGNLLCREQAYPLQIQVNAPVSERLSLSFFVRSKGNPVAVCYSLGPLPKAIVGDAAGNSACGLFRVQKSIALSADIWKDFTPNMHLYSYFSAEEICKLANLISETIVFFEVHLVKFQADKLTLNELNTTADNIKIYQGKVLKGTTLSESVPIKDLEFLEISIGALKKNQHREYFSLPIDQRITFLQKNGAKLSRLLPWRV